MMCWRRQTSPRTETADAEASAARLRQHRATGYAGLETKCPDRKVLENFHQHGSAVVASMRFASGAAQLGPAVTFCARAS